MGAEIDPLRRFKRTKMTRAVALGASVISFILAGAATGLVQFALRLL
jgi:hypothetical protein